MYSGHGSRPSVCLSAAACTRSVALYVRLSICHRLSDKFVGEIFIIGQQYGKVMGKNVMAPFSGHGVCRPIAAALQQSCTASVISSR